MTRLRARAALAALLCTSVLSGNATAGQDAPAAPGRVRVFVDCQNTSCDQDFFRTEMTFVDHVRQRQDADVHVLLTSQSTGAGGNEITLSFFGQERFKGRDHVLRLTTVPAQAQDAIRREIVRVMSIGVIPYALDSPVVNTLTVRTQTAPTAAPAAQDDPWNRWTFRVGANGNTSGEKSNRSLYVNANVSANRTTAAMKLNLSANANYNESRFELGDGRIFIAPTRNYNANGLWVKSLTSHWSAGTRASLNSSSFQNIDRSVGLFPAIEYDLFPYSESTRRLLTFRYEAGVRNYDYTQRTVFGKDTETVAAHAGSAYLSLRQRWGTVSSGFEAASFIPEASKNHVSGWGNINLNLVKGLALNFYSELSSIRDQVYLAAGDVTDEEVLVRQRQLATRYRYYFNFGITYTFGSIYSPVVNPRMSN
jgi:hypothetical protein